MARKKAKIGLKSTISVAVAVINFIVAVIAPDLPLHAGLLVLGFLVFELIVWLFYILVTRDIAMNCRKVSKDKEYAFAKELRNSLYFIVLSLFLSLAFMSRDTLAEDTRNTVKKIVEWALQDKAEEDVETDLPQEEPPDQTVSDAAIPENWPALCETELGRIYVPVLFETMPSGTEDEMELVRKYVGSCCVDPPLEKRDLTAEEMEKVVDLLDNIESINPSEEKKKLTKEVYVKEAGYYKELTTLLPCYQYYHQQGRALLDGLSEITLKGKSGADEKFLMGFQSLQSFQTSQLCSDATSLEKKNTEYQEGQVYHHMGDSDVLPNDLRIELYYFAVVHYENSANYLTDTESRINSKYNYALVLYKANNCLLKDSEYLLDVAKKMFEELKKEELSDKMKDQIDKYIKEIDEKLE